MATKKEGIPNNSGNDNLLDDLEHNHQYPDDLHSNDLCEDVRDHISNESSNHRYVICIVGPTGAGKTAIALSLASYFSMACINADSRQVYADFPIITAQPSAEEQSLCPHKLYGFLETNKKITSGIYRSLALKSIRYVEESNMLPILVGGTGLYFSRLFKGLAPIPMIPEDIHKHWIAKCTEVGSQALYEELQKIDPKYASQIHPNDKQRVTRALEVYTATNKTYSWWHSQPHEPSIYKPIMIGVNLPMSDLEKRLKLRVAQMIAQGALEEAEKAYKQYPKGTEPGWTGIGCKELHQYLSNSINLEECKELWIKNTRAYAKRQNTWFRSDSSISWFSPTDSSKVLAYIKQKLGV